MIWIPPNYIFANFDWLPDGSDNTVWQQNIVTGATVRNLVDAGETGSSFSRLTGVLDTPESSKIDRIDTKAM